MSQIKAPWTVEQVSALSAFQNSGRFHPFTCPNHSQVGELIPTVSGWIYQFCDYKQDWAHEFMTMPLEDDAASKFINDARIERMAIAMARTEMVLELGDAGVMAMSKEGLERTFKSAWEGTTDHDEHCRERFRALAKAAYAVVWI